MNNAGCCQIIRLFYSGLWALKIATGVLRPFGAQFACNKNEHFNRTLSDMSKCLSQIKSLHNHVITVIMTPVNSEFRLQKHSL